MRSDDQNSVLDEDELEPLYHLDESGQLTWTEEGLRTYRKRFARFGLRIEAVVTHDQLRTALQISAAGLTDQLLAIAENGPRWQRLGVPAKWRWLTDRWRPSALAGGGGR